MYVCKKATLTQIKNKKVVVADWSIPATKHYQSIIK